MTKDFLEYQISAGDGLSLYTRDYRPRPGKTQGPAVLCLGGLTRNSKDFHGLALILRNLGHRVVCPDYRGRGQSGYDTNPQNYRPEVYISDIHHVTAALGVGPFVAIGTSLGGVLSSALSVAMPMAVLGAVINDVGPDMDPKGIANIVRYVENSAEQPSLDAAITHMRETFPSLPAETEEEWRLIAEATYRPLEASAGWRPDWDPKIAIPLKGATGPDRDLWPFFQGLGNRPSLFIRGQKSDVLSPDTFKEMQSRMPQHHYLEVSGVGHAPSLVAREVLAAITETISRI